MIGRRTKKLIVPLTPLEHKWLRKMAGQRKMAAYTRAKLFLGPGGDILPGVPQCCGGVFLRGRKLHLPGCPGPQEAQEIAEAAEKEEEAEQAEEAAYWAAGGPLAEDDEGP